MHPSIISFINSAISVYFSMSTCPLLKPMTGKRPNLVICFLSGTSQGSETCLHKTHLLSHPLYVLFLNGLSPERRKTARVRRRGGQVENFAVYSRTGGGVHSCRGQKYTRFCCHTRKLKFPTSVGLSSLCLSPLSLSNYVPRRGIIL
jgi:hypothetical protein